MSKHVVIIGAGIVGISTGIWLRRMGKDVTIIDRQTPGRGTSYGNAGVLAACAMVPVTVPGLIGKGSKMLLDRDFPLFMRWPYLPRLLPWLTKFLRNANDRDTRRIAQGLTIIIENSVQQHLSLTEALTARRFVQQSDYNFAYESEAAFSADTYIWKLRQEAGFVPELIKGDAVREYDPAFSKKINLLATMKHHGYVLDPGGYVQALAKDLEALGGTIVKADVKDFSIDGRRVSRVLTATGAFDCDAVVLATGAWSGKLMTKHGMKVPLESERGYHIVFADAENGPRAPVMVTSGKFVATPMSAGLRCAGIVEFGGLDAGPSTAPLELLRRHTKAAFPRLSFGAQETWLGHRPTLSDSLPAIGEIEESGVFTAFGHQHIGLTGGPKTGRLVADLIAGKSPNIDLAPFSPARFR